MHPALAITKALADSNRLRILCALRGGELCVCQIVEILGLAASTTSRHLALLTNAGLLESRKDGRWVHYRLAEEENPAVRDAIQWVHHHYLDSREVRRDDDLLRQLSVYTPEQICQLQASGSRCCSSAPEIPAGAKWQKDGPAISRET